MKFITVLLVCLPLLAAADEHGGKAAEHGGQAAESKADSGTPAQAKAASSAPAQAKEPNVEAAERTAKPAKEDK